MDVLEIDKQMMDALAPVIKGFVDRAINRATEPLLERIAVLEAREPVVVEKMAAEPVRLDEFRNEFGAFLSGCREDIAVQKTAAADLRAQLPAPAELRKAVETVALESRATLAEMAVKAARLETELREKADADTARVTEALKSIEGVHTPTEAEVAPAVEMAVANAVAALPKPRNGDSVTVDDVRPVIEAEIARKFDGAPKAPDEAAIYAAITEGIERRIPDAAELDRRLLDIEKRATESLPLQVAGAVSEALLAKMEPIAKLASSLVDVPKAPTLPDIPAMVSKAVTEATAGFVTVNAVADEIQKSANDLRAELASHSEAEIQSIARDTVKGELARQPPGLTVDDVQPLIERAIMPLREAIDGLPEPPDMAEAGRITVEKAAALVAPDIAALGKRIDDLPAVDERELENLAKSAADDQLAVPDHLLGLVERVSELLSQPFATSLDATTPATVLPRKKSIRLVKDDSGNTVGAEVTEVTEI